MLADTTSQAVTPDSRRRRPRRTGPRATYLTIRITGVLLAVLALGHFAATHLVTDVAETGSSFIARRWQTALWIGWDATMLATALLHGAAGLMVMVRDYRTDPLSRARWTTGIAGSAFLLFVIGAATLTYSALGTP